MEIIEQDNLRRQMQKNEATDNEWTAEMTAGEKTRDRKRQRQSERLKRAGV